MRDSVMEFYLRVGHLEGLRDKFNELGIHSVKDVEDYCMRRFMGVRERNEPFDKDGLWFFQLAHVWRYAAFLPPFGTGNLNLYAARVLFQTLREEIKSVFGCEEVYETGALRRREPVVNPLELVVSADDPVPVTLEIERLPCIEKRLQIFNDGVTALTRLGVEVKLTVCKRPRIASALNLTTGPREHVTALNYYIQKMGLRNDELGLRADLPRTDPPDRAVYDFLKLPWIPPEARRDGTELQLALMGELQTLPPQFSPQGDTHVHTTYGDGYSTPEQMVQKARELGHKFLVISDHSHAHTIANGLSSDALRRQVAEIRRLQAQYQDIKLLAGHEAEILDDGTIDCPLPKGGPEGLDWVNAGLHHPRKDEKIRITTRILTAMEDPRVDAIVHPRGLYTTRKPNYEVDMGGLIRGAGKFGVALEFNCFPDRLDLDSEMLELCRKKGVKIVTGSDSHGAEQMPFIFNGIQLLRRIGARESDFADVLNRQRTPGKKV